LNSNYLQILSIISLSLLTLNGCGKRSGDLPENVLAKVGSDELTIEEAIREVPSFLLNQDSTRVLEQYREQWTENKIIENEAYKNRVHLSNEYKSRLESFERELLRDLYKEMLIAQFSDQFRVTRDEAQNYYQANKEQFVLNEKHVRYRHLSTRTQTEAASARRELLNGESWENVVNKYSTDPEGQLKNVQRFYPISMAGGNIEIMNRYLRVIGLSEISPIARSGNAFHFVQLLEEKAEGDHPDLDWLVEQIKEWLYLEKTRKFINSHIRNLYLEAEANNEIGKTYVDDVIRNYNSQNTND